MKHIVQILILIFLVNQVYGQVNSKDLNGEWIINNYTGESYFKSDTIELIQNINFLHEYNTSNIVIWNKDKRKISIHFINNQKDSCSKMNYYEEGKIKLLRNNKNQFIEIRNSEIIIETFKVLSLEQNRIDKKTKGIKKLTLERLQNNRQELKVNKVSYEEPPIWYLFYMFQFY